jgi:hypothetical protein
MTLQHRVQDVLDELVVTGAETGLQVAGPPDLLDDTVSASVQVPAVQTMIVISGMQFPLAG